jgi:hypothetical protein
MAVVRVPAAFPRHVRNDPVGHINLHFLSRPRVLRFPFLHRRGELIRLFCRRGTVIATLNEFWLYFTTDHEQIGFLRELRPRGGADHCSVKKNDGDNCLESYRVLPDCRTSQGNEI